VRKLDISQRDANPWQLPRTVVDAGISGKHAEIAKRQAQAVATNLTSGRTVVNLKMVVNNAFSASDDAIEKALPILPKVACKRGCAWCCYMKVEVGAPEVFRLADYLKETMTQTELNSLLSRLRVAWKITGGLPPDEHVRSGVPCPLLDVQTNSCHGYAFRPFSCRAWNSTDVAGCERSTHEENVTTPNNIAQTLGARSVAYGMHVGLAFAGNFVLDVYDLNGSLLIALETVP
jgi:Fe-S-cluster containining protein